MILSKYYIKSSFLEWKFLLKLLSGRLESSSTTQRPNTSALSDKLILISPFLAKLGCVFSWISWNNSIYECWAEYRLPCTSFSYPDEDKGFFLPAPAANHRTFSARTTSVNLYSTTATVCCSTISTIVLYAAGPRGECDEQGPPDPRQRCRQRSGSQQGLESLTIGYFGQCVRDVQERPVRPFPVSRQPADRRLDELYKDATNTILRFTDLPVEWRCTCEWIESLVRYRCERIACPCLMETAIS